MPSLSGSVSVYQRPSGPPCPWTLTGEYRTDAAGALIGAGNCPVAGNITVKLNLMAADQGREEQDGILYSWCYTSQDQLDRELKQLAKDAKDEERRQRQAAADARHASNDQRKSVRDGLAMGYFAMRLFRMFR